MHIQRLVHSHARWISRFVSHFVGYAKWGPVQYYAGHPRIKIVFAGINGEIEPYGYHKLSNVTGILERKQWGGVKNLIDETVRARVPAERAVKIACVGDSSGSVKEDTKFLNAFDWKPFVLHRSKLVKTFDEWQAELRRANLEADVLLTTNYRRIQLSDSDEKKMVPPVYESFSRGMNNYYEGSAKPAAAH